MNTVPKICITLIALALGVFFSSYFYYQSFLGNEYEVAHSISKITSAVSPAEQRVEPVMVAGNEGIYEERAILVLFGIAAFISLLSIVVAVVARFKRGQYQLFVPLAFCAATVIGCIAFTAYKSGLYLYA